jgi:hypothetical protein
MQEKNLSGGLLYRPEYLFCPSKKSIGIKDFKNIAIEEIFAKQIDL